MSDSAEQEFDVVVVGAGVAGLTAAATAAELKLRVVVLEQLGPGGQLIETSVVDDPLLGKHQAPDLAAALMERAMDAGAILDFSAASSITLGERYRVESGGGAYSAPAVVLAMGSTPRRIGIPGEDEFSGRGVSYCVTCDGPLFGGKAVALLGSGLYAAQEVAELRQFVGDVTVISLGAGGPGVDWTDSLEFDGNLRLLADARPTSIEGDADTVSALRVAGGDGERRLEVQGVFVSAGRTPATELVRSLVELDRDGRIVVNASLNTGTPGLYAVGDVRAHAPERVISAAADGVTAVTAITREDAA